MELPQVQLVGQLQARSPKQVSQRLDERPPCMLHSLADCFAKLALSVATQDSLVEGIWDSFVQID